MKYPYIHKVEILNFRNFRELKIVLEPTCVIVGENRSGKSNFLDALRLVLDPSLPDSFRSLRAEDFWDGLEKPFGGNIIEIKVYIRGFEDNKGAEAILADCIIKSEPLTALLTYVFRPRKSIEKEEPTESDYEYVVFGGSDEKNRVASDVRKWLSMFVLPALRDAETDMQSWRKSPLRPLLDRTRALIDQDRLAEVRDKLDEATKELLKEPSIKKLTKDINKRVNDLVGPVHSVESHFDFASSEPEQLLRSIRLFLKEGQNRSLADVSLGTANVLFLSLLLQDLDARREAKEIVSTILAIEEPEAHIHPHLQRLLFRHFLRREHSIIVTTHSPNLVSVAPLKSLVLLRTENGQSKCFTPRNLGLATEEINDLQRYLDVTRAEMLFAKGVIFVEGVAEQFLIPAYAIHQLKKNEIAGSLDELGISICSVNGTDFYPFSRVLSDKGLAIPNVIITDGDIRKNNGDIIYEGLLRGKRLLDEKTREKIGRLISEERYDDVSKALVKEGIFVGEYTLEIDLLASIPNEMKETYKELVVSEKASNKFADSVDAALDGESKAMEDIIKRIERIGKGRYAQRLASKINDQSPPTYIRKAIDYIINIVYKNNA